MPLQPSLILLILISSITIIACGSDSTSPGTQVSADADPDSGDAPIIVQQGLLDNDWTLETVRDTDGQYWPLPLDATWRLSFAATGSVGGDALCNAASGYWQSGDTTLTISDWNEDGAYCPSSETISIAARTIVARLLSGDPMMPTVNSGRLFLDTADNAQLVFSGRAKRDNAIGVSVETLVRTTGFSRASNGSPVFGDQSSPFVIYRDTASLEADFAMLPAEGMPWPALPSIDFSNSIVIGAYLPLNGSVSSDVHVRSASLDETGLAIEVARYDTETPDEASVECAAAEALTAPWALVRIDSVAEPVRFSQMRRAFCSGIPFRD